jgi:HSP20 family protein
LVRDINRLQQQMRRIMEDMVHQLSPRFLLDQRVWSPQMDIVETPQTFVILADTAGLIKNEIQVTIKKNLVYLFGRRERPSTTENQRFLQMEIEYGSFERVFQLPSLIDEDRIEAKYQDGLLTITLPKKQSQAKTIPIK